MLAIACKLLTLRTHSPQSAQPEFGSGGALLVVLMFGATSGFIAESLRAGQFMTARLRGSSTDTVEQYAAACRMRRAEAFKRFR